MKATTNMDDGGLLEERMRDMLMEERTGEGGLLEERTGDVGVIEGANIHVNKNYCPECGKKYSSESIAFCPYCGHPRRVKKTW